MLPHPDVEMSDKELRAAEAMMLCGEISQSDLLWLMGVEKDETDRPVPRGFRSWRHFNAFLWHKEQKAKGRPVKRKRASR